MRIRSDRRLLAPLLAFTLLAGSLTGVFGLENPALATSHLISSWDELAVLDADEVQAGVQLAPGRYVVTGTIEVPDGATVEGSADTAWEPTLLFRDSSGNLVNNLCDENATDRSAVTICAQPKGPGFSAFSVATGSARLANLTITGASTNGNGGAISVAAGARLDLVDAFIFGNRADEGAGLYNAGTAVVRQSTFQANTAGRKGGGIENDGTLSLVNSTLTENVGKGGGGLSTAGTAYLSFVTVYTNASTNKIGAGTLRNGGTLVVKSSIIANNVGSDGAFHDCSGTPNFIGVNLVSDAQGCNPGNQTIDLSTKPGNPTLDMPGPGDFGGLTPTHPLMGDDDGSAFAIDATADCTVLDETGFDDPHANGEVGTDQRAVDRDDSCDLGAYESSIRLSATLTTSTDNVSVGAVSAPLREITLAIQQAAAAGTSVRGTPLSAIPLSAITIADAPLSAITLEDVPLSAIPLSAIPLSAIPLSAIPLSAIPLSAIPLSAIPLSAIDSVLLSDVTRTDGASLELLLEGSIYEGWPLLALTFADLASLSLTAFGPDLNSTLASIPLSAIPLSAIDNVVDCDSVGVDCESDALGAITPKDGATVGDVIGLDDLDLRSTPLSAIPLSAIAVGTLPLSAIPLSAIANGTELTGLAAWCEVLGAEVCSALGVTAATDNGATLISAAVVGADLTEVPLSAIPLSAIPLSAIPLSAIPLSAIDWQATPLSAIPLSAIGATICEDVDITDGISCSGADLTLLDVATSSGLSFTDTASIGDLDDAVDGFDYVLWDLLFGIFGARDIPWALAEDLNGIRLPAADADPSLAFDYSLAFTIEEGPGAVTIDLDLPAGFVPVDGSASLGTETVSGVETQDAGNTAISLRFELGTLDPGSYTLTIPVWAGVELGSFTATARVEAAANTIAKDSDTASVSVGESGAANRTISADNMEIAHVSSSNDTEIFELQVPGEIIGASVRLLLSNLGADLDLVLFGPPVSGYLRGTPEPGFGAIEDHRYDLNPDDDVLDADVLDDVNLDPAKLGLPGDLVPIAVSANRGTANEEIEARIPTAGPYYAAVSGYNGASSQSAFALQGRFSGNPVTCDGGALPWSAAASYPTLSAPDGVNTLILYNRGRLASDPSGLLTYLDGFASDPGRLGSGVVAMAVPIDGNSTVRTQLSEWYTANGRCNPESANDVVRAVGGLIDGLSGGRAIENIVIVGDDSHVPFARLIDRVTVSNEAEFGATLPAEAGPELRAALAGGYYFSDDPYGSDNGIRFADGEFFVPERAVGRLVETPADILGQFQDFVTYGGLLDETTGAASEAFVSGYDFLTDGSEAVKTGLGGIDSNVSALINETWTALELQNALSAPLAVASVNAHFDQFRLLPAAGNAARTETDLFTVADLAGISTIFDGGALLFSMGCHSGLSVSNVQIGSSPTGSSPTWAGDWAESFAGVGALWVANTGYGYGDSEKVAYSESISAYFSELLDEATAGEAWVRAKQRFASGLFSVTPYHTKSMNEFVFYGLPMFQTVTAANATPADPATAGSGPSIGADPLGSVLPVAKVSVGSQLTRVDTPEGAYYSGDGGTLEVRGRAITALTEIDVTRPDGFGGLADEAVGVVVTGLTSEEETGFKPLFFNPTSGYTGTEDRPFVSDSTFPAGLARLVSYVDDQGQKRQKVILAATRFRPGPQGHTGVLEKHTSFELDVYYESSPSADVTPPLIDSIEGVSDGEIAYFEVEAIGDGSPDDTQRVNVLFAPLSSSALTWKHVELARVPGTNRWVGGAPIGDWTGTEFAFWVQACDAAGNCGASTAKGVNFLTTDSTSTGVKVEVASGDKVDASSDWFVSDVVVRATSQATGAQLSSYLLDGTRVSVSGTSVDIAVSGDGAHFVIVEDSAGNTGSLLVAIDKTRPTVGLTEPNEESFPSVPFQCTDVLSGISTCTATVTDSLGATVASATGAASGLGVSAGTIDLPTGTVGDFTLTVTATDVAGNEASPEATFLYSIADDIPPTIDITSPVDGTLYPLGTDLKASFTCDDNSGTVDVCTATLDGASILNDGIITTDTVGLYTLTVTASDGDNQVTKSVSFAVGYHVCLLYDPLQEQPAGGAQAIKLQICDDAGANLSKAPIKVTAVSLISEPSDENVELDPQDSGGANSDPSFEFRYDPKLKGYIYNLKQDPALAPGSYTLRFTVGGTGGYLYEAPFRIK